MKVVGLNGRTYNLDTSKYIVKHNSTHKKSQYHLKARELLNEMFAGFHVLEEVKLPGSRDASLKSALFLDFFVSHLNLAIEVHGQQHYQYSKFFHKTMAGFLQSQRRDTLKAEWCENNDITLIVLCYSDDIDVWREQIEQF